MQHIELSVMLVKQNAGSLSVTWLSLTGRLGADHTLQPDCNTAGQRDIAREGSTSSLFVTTATTNKHFYREELLFCSASYAHLRSMRSSQANVASGEKHTSLNRIMTKHMIFTPCKNMNNLWDDKMEVSTKRVDVIVPHG